MNFTQHTAMRAAEQIAKARTDADLQRIMSKVPADELSSLEAMIRAEIQDRNYRDMQQADRETYQFNIWTVVGGELSKSF